MSHPDSLLLARAMAAETTFFALWRKTWLWSMDSALGSRGELAAFGAEPVITAKDTVRRGDSRVQRGTVISPSLAPPTLLSRAVNDGFRNMHCHWDWVYELQSLIRSTHAAQAMCPSWLRDSAMTYRRAVEPHIRAALQGRVADARVKLTTLLDSAAVRMPANAWVVGQRVRFALDGGDAVRALSIATKECATNAWWCSALTGFVLAQSGDVHGADSAFVRAIAVTAGDARCQWTDVRNLLERDARRAYASAPCARQDSIATTLTWLADPLWSDSVNEWRAENFNRRTMIMLRSASQRDELFTWPSLLGGDATSEMIARYGMPTVMQWFGMVADGFHEIWMRGANLRSRPPYTSAEYSTDRYHLTPVWTAVASPLTAAAGDWTLSDPDSTSWPLEHMRLPYVLTQLNAFQVAAFRRDTSALLSVAIRSPGPLRQSDLGDSTNAVTIRATRPHDARRIAAARPGRGRKYTFAEPMRSGGALLSIEFGNDERTEFWRTRFSVEAPPTLASMKRGEQALSDIALIAPPDSEFAALPSTPVAALPLLLESTTFRSGTKRIGLYWETYGFLPGDSVDVSVRVQRYTDQGLLRRVGIALGSATDRNTPISFSWREPEPGRIVSVLPGRVPTVARSLVLDISTLITGDYWLDVSVAAPGQTPIVSRREFVVR